MTYKKLLPFMKKFVTANVVDGERKGIITFQGVIIHINEDRTYIVKGIDRTFQCKGDPVLVSNPPETCNSCGLPLGSPCKRCTTRHARIIRAAEVLMAASNRMTHALPTAAEALTRFQHAFQRFNTQHRAYASQLLNAQHHVDVSLSRFDALGANVIQDSVIFDKCECHKCDWEGSVADCTIDERLIKDSIYTIHLCAYCGEVIDDYFTSDSDQGQVRRGSKEQLKDKIKEILTGIDQVEIEEGGWWETSTGAEFGCRRLHQVLNAVDDLWKDE